MTLTAFYLTVTHGEAAAQTNSTKYINAIKKGNSRYKKEQFQDAMIWYRRARKIEGQEYIAQNNIALSVFALGSTKRAEHYLNLSTSSFSNNLNGTNYGLVLLNNDKYAEAGRVLKSVNPFREDWLTYNYALALYNSHDYEFLLLEAFKFNSRHLKGIPEIQLLLLHSKRELNELSFQKDLEEIRKSRNGSTDAYWSAKGVAYLRNNQYKSASIAFNNVSNNELLAKLNGQLNVQLAKNNFDKARKSIAQMRLVKNGKFNAVYGQALLAFKEKQYQKSKELFRKSLLIRNCAKAYIGEALCLKELGQPYSAILILERVDAPEILDKYQVHYTLANLYLETELFYKSDRAFHTCETLIPGSLKAGDIYNWALATIKIGELQKAKERLFRSIQLKPNYEAFLALSTFSLEENKLVEGINHLKSAIKMDNTRLEPYVLLGNHYQRINEFSKAEKTYSRGLQIDPDHTGLLNGRACAQKALLNFENAIADYIAILHNCSRTDSIEVINNLAFAFSDWADYLELTGNEDQELIAGHRLQSLDLIKQAIDLDSLDRYQLSLNNNMGVLFYAYGNIDSAVARYNKSAGFVPTNNLGAIRAREGELREALDLFEIAEETAGDYPIPHYNAKVARANLNQKRFNYYSIWSKPKHRNYHKNRSPYRFIYWYFLPDVDLQPYEAKQEPMPYTEWVIPNEPILNLALYDNEVLVPVLSEPGKKGHIKTRPVKVKTPLNNRSCYPM